MKKQTSLTGKQIDILNKVMSFSWIVCFLAACILVSRSLSIDSTWVSAAIFVSLCASGLTAILAWWYKNSY